MFERSIQEHLSMLERYMAIEFPAVGVFEQLQELSSKTEDYLSLTDRKKVLNFFIKNAHPGHLHNRYNTSSL